MSKIGFLRILCRIFLAFHIILDMTRPRLGYEVACNQFIYTQIKQTLDIAVKQKQKYNFWGSGYMKIYKYKSSIY